MAFKNDRSGPVFNTLHTIIISPQSVCNLLEFGAGTCCDLQSPANISNRTSHGVVTSFLTSSHQHSESKFMLHTYRYTRRRAGHIWPICTAAILTYGQVQSHVISRLSTSKHVAFFKTLRTPWSAIPPRDTNWWTIPTAGGTVITTQGGIGLTETSGIIRLSRNVRQDGPHTVRYCSGTCFFFHLRQNCRYQRFFFHLRASKLQCLP